MDRLSNSRGRCSVLRSGQQRASAFRVVREYIVGSSPYSNKNLRWRLIALHGRNKGFCLRPTRPEDLHDLRFIDGHVYRVPNQNIIKRKPLGVEVAPNPKYGRSTMEIPLAL